MDRNGIPNGKHLSSHGQFPELSLEKILGYVTDDF
jgi:hypothetical protein